MTDHDAQTIGIHLFKLLFQSEKTMKNYIRLLLQSLIYMDPAKDTDAQNKQGNVTIIIRFHFRMRL
jgi:hypothetical protein